MNFSIILNHFTRLYLQTLFVDLLWISNINTPLFLTQKAESIFHFCKMAANEQCLYQTVFVRVGREPRPHRRWGWGGRWRHRCLGLARCWAGGLNETARPGGDLTHPLLECSLKLSLSSQQDCTPVVLDPRSQAWLTLGLDLNSRLNCRSAMHI